MSKRWALRSYRKRGLFDVLRDPDAITWLSTVELPELRGLFATLGDEPGVRYESCYFEAGLDSDVVATYSTQAEARRGHERLRVELGLEPGVEVAI